jgi:hypothetical protein
MATALVSRYSDILSYGATWSLTAGSANSAFPLTNLNDVRADYVSKTTAQTCTYKAAIASTALQAVAFVNCNRPGVNITVTNNNAMASQNLAIPAAPSDNIGISGILDLRAVTTAATEWSFAVPTGSGNVAVGKILLISNLRQFLIRSRPKFRDTSPKILKRSSSGTALGYPKGVRYRGLEFQLMRESERAGYELLRRGSVGPSQPCIVWPNPSINDFLYAFFPPDSWQHERESEPVTTWTDEVEEMNPGVSL